MYMGENRNTDSGLGLYCRRCTGIKNTMTRLERMVLIEQLQIIANTNNRFEMETHYVFGFYWHFLKSVGRFYTF